MELGLQGKVAIVTGSSEGIGFAIAEGLAREGARVVICARREPLLTQAAETIAERTGGEVLAVTCDVQRTPDVRRLAERAVERFGTIDILVNNAGSVPRIQFGDQDDAELHQLMEAKVLNYLRVVREVLPALRKGGGGRIINIAGAAGWQPTPASMAVGFNNAAVLNWTKSLSLQCAGDGILVNAVVPGSIETPRQTRGQEREAEIRGLTPEAIRAERTRDIPLQRSGRPEEIADVVVFVASDRSSYLTGTSILVDGGSTRGF
jgi:NAD(P)-dependent dehydrogenase (short-subunit alcohol dehydrogenase family)